MAITSARELAGDEALTAIKHEYLLCADKGIFDDELVRAKAFLKGKITHANKQIKTHTLVNLTSQRDICDWLSLSTPSTS